MVITNLKETLSVYDVTQQIGKIYKGTLLVYGGWKDLIASGVLPLTLEKCKGVNLLDYKIHGNSVQSGIPTPTTPIEIKSVGTKTINLLPYPYIDTTKTTNGVTFTDNGDGTITAVGTATADAHFILCYHKSFGDTSMNAILKDVASNGTYTVSKRIFYNSDNAYLSISITLVKGTTIDETICPMIVEGVYTAETMPEYEPYNKYKVSVKVSNDTEEIRTNIYLNEPLRKIGDYVDYIDFKKGKVIRNFTEYVYDGSYDEYWIYNKSNDLKSSFYITCPNNDENWRIPNESLSLCSHAQQSYNIAVLSEKSEEDICGFACANTTNFLYFCILNSELESLDATGLKKWLNEQYTNGNPLTVLVRAIKPIRETIDLPNIPTLKGTTIFSVDDETQPTYMEVVYKGKGKLNLLDNDTNVILNYIVSTDTETELNITYTEINEILDEIIGG